MINHHFKYCLLFVVAGIFLPDIPFAGAMAPEYGMPGIIWGNDLGKPGEFSIANSHYSNLTGIKYRDTDYLWDYLGIGSSYEAHFLKSSQSMLYSPGHTYMLDSVLGVDASDKPSEDKSSGMFSWETMKNWPKEKKLIALNLTAIGTIMAVGIAQWDQGSSSFDYHNEGWFDDNTKYGGADKLGHAFSAYALTDIYNGVYKKWGFSDEEAIWNGVFSSWLQMTLIEFGDGFSETYGFSWEDEVMNTLGVGISYLRNRYPTLKDKFDFRMEWRPSSAFRHGDQSEPFTDYSGQKYLLAFKPDGFLNTDNPLLKTIEIHFGYYTRGYDGEKYASSRHRSTYIGLGLNVTYLLEQLTGHRAGGIFNYYQVPYTYISSSSKLD